LNKKVFLIVNPLSGQMKIRTELCDVIELFCGAGYDVTVHTTMGKNDARKQVACRGNDFDMIVCCGGDGTLNETVSGMIDAGLDLPLGYIPAGTTNDFATSVGLPKNILSATETVLNGEEYAVDVGRFGESEYFIYLSSFGAFTKVSYTTSQESKNSFGHFAYILESVKELSEIRPYKVRISGKGFSIEENVLFASVSNTTVIGGVIGLPEKFVNISDGMIEVLLIKYPKNMAQLNSAVMSLKRHNFNDSSVLLMHCSEIEFFSDEAVAWTRDGEDGGEYGSVSLSNIRRGIRIILPSKNK